MPAPYNFMKKILHRSYKIPSFLTALIMALPVVLVLAGALQLDWEIWAKLWKNRLPKLLVNSLLLVTTVTIGATLVGSVLAWLVERTDLPLRKIIKPLLASTLIVPCYITAICYTSFFGMRGLLEKMLASLGWEGHVPNIYGFWGAAGMLTIGTYPYVYAIVSAAIRRLDPSLSDAAKMLGANRFKRLFRIVLPIIFPAMMAGGSLAALYALSDFGVVSLLRYQTFVSAIYEQMSGRYDYRMASALSLTLILLTMAFLMLPEWINRQKRFSSISPRVGRYTPFKLGIAQIPALIFVGGTILIGLFLPVGILIYWFAQSLDPSSQFAHWGSSFTEVIQSGINSLSVSAVSATLAVLLSLPLAYWTVRKSQSTVGKILGWVAQSGIALPGVLIAFGISLFFIKTIPALNFSITAIILAMLIHFFAQSFQSIRSGFTQVSVRLEDSARLLGCSPVVTFWRVTRPLLKPSLMAGWMLVFLSAIRELPASLLLRPAGFDTLTVKVWIAASEGFYAQAAGPALMLVLLSLPLVFAISYGQGDRYAYD